MWVCEVCHRQFNKKQPNHSCRLIYLDDFLLGKPDHIQSIVLHCVNKIGPWPGVRLNCLTSSLLFSVKSNFCSVKLGKDHVDVEFLMVDLPVEFPIFKVIPLQQHKSAYVVRLNKPEDFDDQLQAWITQAYQLNCKK